MTDRVYAVCGESSAMVISMVCAAEPSRFVLQGKPLGVCNMYESYSPLNRAGSTPNSDGMSLTAVLAVFDSDI